MNLLIISTWCPVPPTNGSKLRAYHLVTQLAARHRVHLLTFAEPGDAPHLDALRTVCASVASIPGNPAKAPSRLDALGLIGTVPRSYAQNYSEAMQALIDARLPDVDAAVVLQIGVSPYLLHRPGCLRVLDEIEVTSIREAVAGATSLPERLRRQLTWWKLGNFVRHLTSTFDFSTVVSDVERGHLIAAGCRPAKVGVLPNGVDAVDLDRPLATPEPFTLIYSGALTYSANYDAVRWFLSEIFPRIRQQEPRTRLAVTGSTTGVDLRGLGNTEGCVFTGFVDDIKSLVASRAALVVPLRLGGGTRLKVLEAMALGVPVVSTTKGLEGLDVVAGEHALVGDTPEAFSKAVLRVCSEPETGARLRQRARALVAALYTWQRIGQTLSDTLETLAAERRRGAAS